MTRQNSVAQARSDQDHVDQASAQKTDVTAEQSVTAEQGGSIHAWRWLAFMFPLLALALHVNSYSFLNDDAYISFRYAAHWVDHGEISYNLGERVEGYTNFLWVALLATARSLGAEIPTASLWFSGLMSGLTLAILWRLGARVNAQLTERGTDSQEARPLFASILVTSLIALSPSFACWTSGGLEVQLFTLLFVLSVMSSASAWRRGGLKRGLGAGVAYALLALTRPEGVLLFGVAGLYRVANLIYRRERWGTSDWGGVLGFTLLYAPYFLWRYQYYGYLFPNTYYAKVGASGFWVPGLYYILSWLKAQPWLILAPCAVLWGAYQRRSVWSDLRGLTLISSVTLLIHVARVGGDFMAMHRFLVPLLPLGALLASVTIVKLTRRSPRALLLVILCVSIAQVELARREHRYANRIGSEGGVDSIGWLRRFSTQCAEVGQWIAKNTDPNATLATTAAGALPYYAERYTLDLLGLNDAWIAHNVPARGHRPGHTKSAPFRYPLERKINYLIYHPTFSAQQKSAHPRYARALKPWGYQWQSYHIPSMNPGWWSVWVHSETPPPQVMTSAPRPQHL